jgi:hypothetical protein
MAAKAASRAPVEGTAAAGEETGVGPPDGSEASGVDIEVHRTAEPTGGPFDPSSPGALHFRFGDADTWAVEEAQELVRLGAATTVPLRRLGVLLRDARLAAGEALDAVAARSDGRFDVLALIDVEAGQHHLTDDDVTALLANYRADPGDLLASRSTLVIDLQEGTVAAGSWSTSFPPDADDPDEVLSRYLALLYEMRGLEPGTAIPLRNLDISVLSSALALPAPIVHERLVVMMEPGDLRVQRSRRLLRRRVLVPAAGLVVAATTVGVLIFSPAAEPTPGTEVGRVVGSVAGTPQVAPPGADEPELGDGLTIEAPQVAPPGADEPELGDGLTIERDDS